MRFEFILFQIARGNRRLSKLADRLDVVDAEREAAGLPGYSQAHYTHPCGTPACALGHYPEVTPRWKWVNSVPRMVKSGSYVTLDAQKEFSLTAKEVYETFSADGCDGAKSGKEAAKFIRRFVCNRERRLARLKSPARRSSSR